VKLPASRRIGKPADFSIRQAAGRFRRSGRSFRQPAEASGKPPDREAGRVLHPASRRKHPAARRKEGTGRSLKTKRASQSTATLMLASSPLIRNSRLPQSDPGLWSSRPSRQGRLLQPISSMPTRIIHPSPRRGGMLSDKIGRLSHSPCRLSGFTCRIDSFARGC
jgi:hypothetical protein